MQKKYFLTSESGNMQNCNKQEQQQCEKGIQPHYKCIAIAQTSTKEQTEMEVIPTSGNTIVLVPINESANRIIVNNLQIR